MIRKLWLFLFTLFCSGCTAQHDTYREQLATLPNHYKQFDMALAWELKQAGPETVVDGVLKNLRYAFMEDIEVWVAVVDAGTQAQTRSVCFVIPHQVRQDQVVPFDVKLPQRVAPGVVLKFTYKYRGSDGGDGGVSWMQSFEWVVPEGRGEGS